ncbi:MAG: hypothetical protein J5651_02730 [Salinivirgaceae bacterium]|nr:hypothetical protein [Salinivirgaceae bacterium]
MKRNILLIGALCVSALFVSCIDEEESAQVTAIRKANADKVYISMYSDAVNEIKNLESTLSYNQRQLDDLKDGIITDGEARDYLVNYYNKKIQAAQTARYSQTLYSRSYYDEDYNWITDYSYMNRSDFNSERDYNDYLYGEEKAWDEYINDLKESIDNVNNSYTDVETMIKEYENIIAQLNYQISFQQMIANKASDYFSK